MQKIKTLLIFLAIIAFFGGLIYLFVSQRGKNQALQQRAAVELFDPYLDLLKQSKFADAYQNFTNQEYKKKFSANEFDQNYQKQITDKGAIDKYEIYSVEEKDMFGENKNAEATIRIYFSNKSSQSVRYVIQNDDSGKYKIVTSVRSSGSTYLAEAW